MGYKNQERARGSFREAVKKIAQKEKNIDIEKTTEAVYNFFLEKQRQITSKDFDKIKVLIPGAEK